MTTGGLFLYIYLLSHIRMNHSSTFGPHKNVGTFVRHHGFQGGLVLVSDVPLEDALEDVEVLFVWLDNLPVPFFVDSFQFTGDTSAIVHFQEASSREASALLLGCRVTCPETDWEVAALSQKTRSETDPLKDPGGHADTLHGQSEEADALNDLSDLSGFEVSDSENNPVGPVTVVNNFNGNVVLEVRYQGKPILLPFHPDLVINLDPTSRKLQLTIPDGLLE